MKLVEFLTAVVADRAMRERFSANPEGTISQADLSREAQKAIRSGDPKHVAFVICVAEARDIAKFDPVD